MHGVAGGEISVDDRATVAFPVRVTAPQAVPAAPSEPLRHPALGYRIAKRTFDLLAAGGLFILLLPVMLVAVLVVKLSGLPVFFRQERIGRGGKPLTIYKFTTMRRAPFELCVAWEDHRVPPMCQWLRTFRVDELPQLWNIIRGDMSIVGPRPLVPSVVEDNKHRPGYYDRELVKPGLASWAKVRDPNVHFSLDPAMLDDDLWYVERASFMVDMKILVLTPLAVVRGLLQLRATTVAEAAPLEPVLEAAAD